MLEEIRIADERTKNSTTEREELIFHTMSLFLPF